MESAPYTDRFVMVGAGAAARAFALAARRAGLRAAGVVVREPGRAEAVAAGLDCEVVDLAGDPGSIPAELWCLGVSDGAIAEVAAGLAGGSATWSGRTVIHLSGARGAEDLEPLAARGAVTLAFHPAQTFTVSSDHTALDGVSVAITGDAAGRTAGLDLAQRLGLRPLFVDGEDRALYHLATALVSNGSVTLSAVAHEVLATCGIGRDEAVRLLEPLVMASASNLATGTPGSVLTGPVVRGDSGTVESHLERLSVLAPHLLPAVAAITTETVRLAMRSGRLGEADAERILELISRFLGSEEGFPPEMEP